jgi:hypothetical protein
MCANKNIVFLSIYRRINNEFYPSEVHKSEDKQRLEAQKMRFLRPVARYAQ